jgi:hypothetical protein
MNIFETIDKAIAANPSFTIIFFVTGALIWLIGGNVVISLHYRRIGKSIWSGFKPFANPVKDFNNREWLRLILIALIGMAFMSLALHGVAR